MKTIVMLGAALVAAGCGSSRAQPIAADPSAGGDDATTSAPSSGPGSETSGSRLKARELVAEDGTRQFLGWRDTKLGADCDFRAASDGKQRCLPSGGVSAISYYLDASCSSPVYASSSSCSPGAYVLVPVADQADCSSPYKLAVRPVTSPVSPATIYVRSGASCASAPASPSSYYYALGDEVVPSTFVGATADP